jgi:hypothetical protein
VKAVPRTASKRVGAALFLCALLCAAIEPLRAQAADQPASSDTEPQDANAAHDPSNNNEGFQWKPALLESGFLLLLQHSARMVQPKTRRELGGPFWSDYFESVSSIHTWNDSDAILTNYFGHPWMGAITGYLQVFNDPKGRDLEFDASSERYWHSRLKAMAWSAAYSVQYELGPISEASIGNVGLHPPTMAVVDLVVTPVGGFLWMVLEDFLDQRYVSHWEKETSMGRARFLRVVVNPGRSVANLLRFKRPSYRDNRPLN